MVDGSLTQSQANLTFQMVSSMIIMTVRSALCLLLLSVTVARCNSEVSQIGRARSLLTTYEQQWLECEAILERPRAIVDSVSTKVSTQQKITQFELQQLEQAKKDLVRGTNCKDVWRRTVQQHAESVRVSPDALRQALADWESALDARRRREGGAAADHFSWTVDDREFQATDNGIKASRLGDRVEITGVQCGVGSVLSLVIDDRALKLGTLNVGPQFSAMFIPDWRTDTSAEIRWEAESGSVTISAVSEARVSGNVILRMVPGGKNPRGNVRSVNGNFEVSFHDGTVCY